LKQHKIDIFFSANQLVPVFKVRGVKYISAIYDVFHRVNKSFHSKIFRTYIDFFLKLTIKKSDHIVTISQNSKKDIQFFFKVPSSKVSVIYPAADERFMPGELGEVEKLNLKSQYSLPEVFVLYVGVIEIRKNIFTIIKIADRMIEIMPDVKFLFIGRPGFGSKKILKEVIKRKNIVYLNHIDDASLINIYKLSSAFIFPSFYEGYGLPPMEAMKSGVPVLAANTSSLNEILDGGAILIDPSDDEAFTCELIKLLKDEVYNNNWKNKGIKTAEKFSYKKSAAELINVFNSFQN
jgi:glycosyltransferase involved in cell wall biosynthesis